MSADRYWVVLVFPIFYVGGFLTPLTIEAPIVPILNWNPAGRARFMIFGSSSDNVLVKFGLKYKAETGQILVISQGHGYR